jgi:hypothetical protein
VSPKKRPPTHLWVWRPPVVPVSRIADWLWLNQFNTLHGFLDQNRYTVLYLDALDLAMAHGLAVADQGYPRGVNQVPVGCSCVDIRHIFYMRSQEILPPVFNCVVLSRTMIFFNARVSSRARRRPSWCSRITCLAVFMFTIVSCLTGSMLHTWRRFRQLPG